MTMTNEAQANDDGEETRRDRRGRFKRGSSGNPFGRPRKQPEAPKSLAKCFAERLAKEVAVNDNGEAQLLSFRELLAEALVRGTLKAKPKEMLYVVERLEHLAAGALQDEPEEEIFTEEDRRLLEIVQKDYIEKVCCQCERPKLVEVDRSSTRDDFRFE